MAYDYSDKELQNRFKVDLAKTVPDPGYNLLRKYGLVARYSGKTFIEPSIQSSIREYRQVKNSPAEENSEIRFYVDAPIIGAPTIGQKPQSFGPTNPRRYGTISTVKFRMPREPLFGFDYVSDEQAHRLMLNRVCNWCDNFEFETLLIVAAGMRGVEDGWLDGWRIFPQPQSAACMAETLPDAIRRLAQVQQVSEPVLHVAEWQKRSEMQASSGVSYKHAKRADSFIAALDNLHSYLQPRYNNEPAHYGVKPARVILPHDVIHSEADEEAEQYTLFISQKRADELSECKEWRNYQDARQNAALLDRLVQLYGRYGFSGDYVGIYKNIIVVANPLAPVFIRDNQRIGRGLLFGKQAMALSYQELDEDMAEGVRTPYRCRFTSADEGEHVEVEVEFNFGATRMVYQSASDVLSCDCGVVTFDTFEDGSF